jgi:eukaryotic-like serine/threonine-protein kinase
MGAVTPLGAPLNPGDCLDNYQIDSLVARGGMASVFRARDLQSGSTVAIKVPLPEAECDRVFYGRFQREEQIGRKLDHPAVIKEISDGEKSRVYMVLEWADGQLLREVLTREGRLPIDRALKITCRLSEALEYIHSQGVVHRDLKPENVFLDGHDNVKLFDFGIAAVRRARRLTFGRSSNFSGTADYIAPEQIEGKRGDARTDIYSLGVMLYEMLTGKMPFEGENALAVMNGRLHQDAPPPREFNPAISEGLEAIIYKAMARDPRDRYASAAELAWDLQHPRNSSAAKPTRPRSESLSRKILLYTSLAMIPILLFGLMLLVAGRA